MLAIILSCVPKKPKIYLQNTAVVNRNGASLLSWITFSYGFLHQKSTARLPAELSLDNVPAVDSSFRTETLRKRFGDVRAGDRIWLRLLRFCQGPLLLQWSFVLLKAIAEFGSRYALFNLLKGMENNDAPGSNSELWKWVGVMLLGMLSGAVADSWLYWVTSGVLHATVVSALDALVIGKMMRRENMNDSNEKPDKSSNSGEMFRDTWSIARAVLDDYHFPLAALKILLDITYLCRLLSVRSLLIGSLFPVATTLLSKRLAQQHQALQRGQVASQRKNTSSLIEMLQTLHHIRLSSLEHLWNRKLLNSIADMQHHRWETTIAFEKLNFFSNLGPILLASVAISVHTIESGQLSPAVAFTALSFFSNLQGIFAELPAKAATLHKSWISLQELQKFVNYPDQIKSAVVTDKVILEAASLAWPGQTGSDKKATFELTSVDLCFPKSELSVIVGPVGSGKSLLLSALLDEAVITAGRLGRPSVGEAVQDGLVPGSTAYVAQPPWIDNCSIRDNIVFGFSFNQERYDRVLQACALIQDLESLADGDTTIAGAGGSSLSGGQKWRVALARAFYSPAELLILEDVLGAVDTPIANWICRHALAGDVATGRTIILATHRPEFCIEAARYVVTVKDGTAVGKSQVPGLSKIKFSATVSSDAHTTKAEETATKPPSEKSSKEPQSQTQAARTTTHTLMRYLSVSGIRLYLAGAFITVCYQCLNAAHSWWLTKWTTDGSSESSQSTAALWNVSLYLLISIVNVVALTSQALVFATAGMAASRSIYESLIQSVLTATLSWIDSTPFGQLYQIIDTDMHVIDNLIAPAFNGILGTFINLGTIIAVSLYSNRFTAISAVTILAVYAYIGPKMIQSGGRLRPLLGPASHPVDDHTNAMIIGRATIRAFGRTPLFMERYCGLADNFSKVGIHIQIGNCWTLIRSGVLGCAFVVTTAAAMVYNNVDAATAGFTITLALQMKGTLSKLLNQVSAIRMGITAADRVIALTEVPTETDTGRRVADWPSRGSVEIKGVTMKYGPDLPPALKDVSLCATSRQRIGIVGRTGAGKSSLTNALLRFVPVTDGQVFIDGVEVAGASLHQLRSSVRLIPQDPVLFSGTLRANIDPFAEKTDEQVQSVLERVRLARAKPTQPSEKAPALGLDTNIESGGTNLSHGQRQLVCLARAILAQCRVLVLDEATSGMDEATDSAIQKIIAEEFCDATVIVVAHKLLTVASFDKIVVMSQGQVFESGSPPELLENKGMFWDMVACSGEQAKIEAAARKV
ncbi:ABC transporter, transmembrane domain, type 1 [Akanthomyces lecanii RCEF 1005]|uniref:ABC transporter, transmembrane domain, type 1 n=1 Tax=Akanthomyces lecanii RCEF 1005 TaxID=1081108 RepID=A0A168ITI5_CORDF|nr:ABC transporter, transmembrane domain, type 1 [Akanthomyces lecanii RCEF 1005]